MDIQKIDDGCYAVFSLVHGRRQHCHFTIPKIHSPFGIEEFNKVLYLNLEVDNTQLLGDIYKVEKELYEYMKTINGNLEWVSSIKKNGSFKPLWKIRIQKRRNRIMIRSSKAFHEVDFKTELRIRVVLQSIYVYGNKCGAIYFLDEVEEN
jgi:hypothetical protein